MLYWSTGHQYHIKNTGGVLVLEKNRGTKNLAKLVLVSWGKTNWIKVDVLKLLKWIKTAAKHVDLPMVAAFWNSTASYDPSGAWNFKQEIGDSVKGQHFIPAFVFIFLKKPKGY